MREEIIMAGSGGQGIMFAGTLLAHSAMEEGLNVTFFPSYGAEMRGGTANCTVVISDENIGSPVVATPSTLLAMNEDSLKKFAPKVKKNGLILLNSSLIKATLTMRDVEIIKVPATELAEQLGDARVANMVLLGVYIGKKKIISLKSAIESLQTVLGSKKEDLIEMNRNALMKGEKYND